MARLEDRRTQAVAWTTSLAVHTLMTASVVWLGGRGPADGASDEPTREVGIVLRQSSEPPEPFATESDEAVEPVSLAESPSEADAAEAAASSPSPFSDLLADLIAQAPPEGAGPPAGGGANAVKNDAAAAGRPKLPIGKTRVRVFGLEGVGSRFVYAFDRSISMTGPPLRAAKAELIQSLDALEPTHRFQTLFFNTRVSAFDLTGGQRRIAFGTEENKRRAARFVRGVTADGGTDRFNAIMHALRHRPDVVFFLTDAEDPMTASELREVYEEASGAVAIQVIEFGKGPWLGRRNFLVELAEQTGGGHVYVDTERL